MFDDSNKEENVRRKYEELVRIMPRASHRNTGKRRVNQVNEDSKLKSEVYEGAKAICTEGRRALSPIES